jgi:hypothetical protein
MALLPTVTVVLVILKLTDNVDFTWLEVFLPLLVQCVIWFIAAFVAAFKAVK